MSPRTRKPKVYQATQAAIKRAAWRQIAECGAAALSLRAIARKLEVTAPALYRYFPDRDALVTALIIDAFADFGDAQLAAVSAVPEDDLTGRLKAAGRAYRAWAIRHPERYQLIFGTPIPGYEPPVEKVMPVAARSLTALVGVLEALRLQNRLRFMHRLQQDRAKDAMFGGWKKVGMDADIRTFAIAVLIWARVHGLVSLEIGDSLPPFGPSPEAFYRYEVESICREFIK